MGFAARPVPIVFAVIGVLLSVCLLVDAMLVVALYAYSSDGADAHCTVNGVTDNFSASCRGNLHNIIVD